VLCKPHMFFLGQAFPMYVESSDACVGSYRIVAQGTDRDGTMIDYSACFRRKCRDVATHYIFGCCKP
jgi:hypothetical protein